MGITYQSFQAGGFFVFFVLCVYVAVRFCFGFCVFLEKQNVESKCGVGVGCEKSGVCLQTRQPTSWQLQANRHVIFAIERTVIDITSNLTVV